VLSALQSHHVAIVSYDLLRRIYKESAMLERSSFRPLPEIMVHTCIFDVIVADEAHCMRNPKTELYKCMTALKVNTSSGFWFIILLK
jgi:SNF2 family DNA or RNA helicase